MEDFFISYNKADKYWAMGLGDWLDQTGFTTILQEQDFVPSTNFVNEMHKALQSAKRMLMVLSPDYLSAKFPLAEWTAAFASDLTCENRTLIPVRVRECEPVGLLRPIVYIDLVGLNVNDARKAFLGGIESVLKGKRRLVNRPPTQYASPSASVIAQATSPDSIAAAAGRDVHLYFDAKQKPQGRAKPPSDVISEEQGIRLKTLMDEIIELDSCSYGRRLSPAQLQKKWWGALAKVAPNTTYKNYSQKKFEKAMNWLRKQRGRLISGAAPEEPELSRTAAIRAIHVHISRHKLDKLPYYEELSERLGISPPFRSTKDLSDYDLQRVCQAVRRDARNT